MIETGGGIRVYKYEVENQMILFVFFNYLLLFARGEKYSQTGIHQKVFNDSYYFYKVETF